MSQSLSSDGVSPQVSFDDSLMNANPASKIEVDGMDEKGVKYRFQGALSNLETAVLATCLFVRKQRNCQDAIDMTNRINEFNSVVDRFIVTI